MKHKTSTYLETHNSEIDLENFGKALIRTTKQFIERIEELNLTNTQWFIDWEIEMNKLTVKDHKACSE